MFARMNTGADVRSILNEYFQKYLVTTSNGGVYHTNPYYDQTSLGLIISRCKAKKTGSDLKGVACIDFNVYDLLSEIDLFDLYSNMYPFLVNSDGKVILHPYLNPPSENYRDPFLPEISDLEQEDNGMNIKELEKCIRQINIQCEIVADVKRVYPRGHLALHGIQWEIVLSHFICKAIKRLSFTVCLVFDANEKTYVKISLQNFPFTNSLTFMNSINIFDLTDKCSQSNRIALYNATSIVLAPKSFTNPNIYLGTNQSDLDFNNWKNIVAKLNDPQSTFKAYSENIPEQCYQKIMMPQDDHG
ncbi:hypothetical protein HELRODRAFT_173113 [Helobdella robusta]|uniref:Uncharacterized protein n=1 Tax=Helobdella robusta TaxID=6412 RepID=T1F6D7_HELRO|nr:hypothetical protein HELRODRAFT_173113 [Helobdella robusta]ESO04042.1 hypothetical protein HELRODRAFT_173113 [Helobdella robusta]